MAVDSLGGVVGSGANETQRRSFNEEDLLRVFLAQLTFQDPLNPVDSREFLAQLAQFTTVQQTQALNENLQGLLAMQASSQSVGLIGKTVQASRNGQNIVGTVTTLQFSNGQPLMTLRLADGTFIVDVRLSEINLVRSEE